MISSPCWGRSSTPSPRRAVDLVIAATANVHGAVLLTRDGSDLRLVADLVDLREP